MSETAALLEAAFRHHKAGRAAEAQAAYRRILAFDPHHGKALLMLGMLRPSEAESLLRRFLVPDDRPAEPLSSDRRHFERGTALFELAKLRQDAGDDQSAAPLFQAAIRHQPAQASAYRGLSLALYHLGRFREALAAADAALAIDPVFAPAQYNRGLILADLGRMGQAAEAFGRAIVIDPQSADAWTNLGNARLAGAAFEAAAEALQRAVLLAEDHVQARFLLGKVLDRLGRFDEARRSNAEAGRRHGIGHHPCRGDAPRARILLIGGADSCNVLPQFLFDLRRYELLTVYLAHPGEADLADLAARMPPFDIAFNAIADLDRGAPFLEQMAALAALLGRPVLNPPDHRIARTQRDQMAALLAGTPGLVVPQAQRVSRDSLARPGTTWSRPMLLRPVGAHGGDDFRKLDHPGGLTAYLDQTKKDEYYLTEYFDYRSDDGNFRKYRFIFVDREIYPYHLVIGSDWLLHYFRADMAGTPEFKQEEEAFLADWRTALPPAAALALVEIARRLDLDYAGIDCGLTPDGQLLLFEANPCMLVHLRDSPEEFPYKHRYVPRIFDAVDRMVERRIPSQIGMGKGL